MGWSGWDEVSGAGKATSAPAVTNANGQLYAFVHGVEDRIYFNRYSSAWSGWEEVGGNGRTWDAPAAVTLNDEPHVVVRGVEDRIFVNRLD